MQAKPARSHKNREPSEDHPVATAFGDEITADHLDSKGPLSQGFEGANFAVVFKDRGTKWIDCFPKGTKSTEHTVEAVLEFLGKNKVASFYSDSSPELRAAARSVGIAHATATPGRPDVNGVAEAAVRKVAEGTRTVLEHAGFDPRWWPLAARHLLGNKR